MDRGAMCLLRGERGLQPLGELVAACLGLPPASNPIERRGALESWIRALLGDAWSPTYASLGNLLSLPLPPDIAATLEPLSPQSLRVHYLAAVELILRRMCADGPAVVVLEDCHWADPSSVDVVSRLLPLALELPMLLLLTSRPERSAAGWRLVEAARETFGDALASCRSGHSTLLTAACSWAISWRSSRCRRTSARPSWNGRRATRFSSRN